LEEEFQNLIKNEWRSFDGNLGLPPSVQFAESMKIIKSKVINWAAERYKSRDKILKEAEEEICRIQRQ
jgi:hypothetical protein